MTKRYLGDGVYIEVERGMFMLTTEDGIRVTNTIALEPEVYRALIKYADEAFAFYAREEGEKGPRNCPNCGERMDGIQHGSSECNVQSPVDGEFPFHCAEFEGCTETHCAYPGEEDCAMGTQL